MMTGKRYTAEIRCLHCARAAGRWEWAAHAPQGLGTFIPKAGGASRTGLLSRLRCLACGGPVVLLEDVEPVREAQAVKWGPMKRGRKPRQQAA